MFVSIDIETDGPCPGINSMLALGAVAYDGHGESGGYLVFHVRPAAGLRPELETMEWWDTQPEAWAEVSGSRNRARDMIPDFGHWCEALRGEPVVVAWPAVFDFAFVSYYLWRFFGRNPLGYDALDIGSYASGIARYPGYRGLPDAEVSRLAGDIDTAGLRRTSRWMMRSGRGGCSWGCAGMP